MTLRGNRVSAGTGVTPSGSVLVIEGITVAGILVNRGVGCTVATRVVAVRPTPVAAGTLESEGKGETVPNTVPGVIEGKTVIVTLMVAVMVAVGSTTTGNVGWASIVCTAWAMGVFSGPPEMIVSAAAIPGVLASPPSAMVV
jgi:hypothetical protein